MLPNSAKTDVKTTESGFHDGPPAVSSPSRVTSRPQMIHDHGVERDRPREQQDERGDGERGGDRDRRPAGQLTQCW